MEIHAPEHPVRSVREFLIHLAIVTIGILIALSLEGIVEWSHHNHLIREARENIRSEIADNQRELSGHLNETARLQDEQQQVLHWIADILKSHQSSIHSFRLGFNRADLSDASWTTAQTIGTLGLMQYSEVKRGAAIYELQNEFVRLQTRAEDASISAMTLFTASADPTKLPESELKEERSKVEASLAALLAQNQVGRELGKRYAAYLAAK